MPATPFTHPKHNLGFRRFRQPQKRKAIEAATFASATGQPVAGRLTNHPHMTPSPQDRPTTLAASAGSIPARARFAYANVARTLTVMYGNASPVELASTG
jgi:hypothetical protein